ncbi:MAG: hypothetical protein GX549_06500, partial [Clostridiales bacterium]|nr:hypothetical protein [Clostridiales bacterium]
MIWTIASVRVYNGTVAAELAAAGIAELDTLKTGVEQVVSDALISSNMLLSERHCYAVMYGNGINRLKEAELVYSIRSIIALAQTRTYLGVINGKIGRYVGTRGVYIGIEPSIAGRKKNLSFSSDVFVRDVKTGTSQSAETARVLTVLFQPVKMHNTSVEPSFVVTDIALANLWDNMAATIRENDIPVLLWNPQYGTLLAGKSAEKLDDSLCAQAADAAARSGTGYDIISYQGRNYLACGSALKYADLHVLSIQEYAGLVPRMAQIQRVILACAVVSMLLLLTAMFAFSKFTNPVRKLAMRLTGIRTPDDAIRGEILKLKHVLDDFTERHGKTPDKPLADGALRQAILGGPGAAPQAEALLAELGEGARGAARFCVLLFSIDEFRTNASYFDRTYYMYIISSMAREMLPVPL